MIDWNYAYFRADRMYTSLLRIFNLTNQIERQFRGRILQPSKYEFVKPVSARTLHRIWIQKKKKDELSSFPKISNANSG